MREILFSLLVGMTGPLLQQTAQPARPEQAGQPTETRRRFEQALTIRTAERGAQSLKVNLRDLVVRERQTVSLKAEGTMVIQVRAGGPVVTTLNGQRTERKEDEFFVLPAGATMSIQTGNDTAVLTILEVQG